MSDDARDFEIWVVDLGNIVQNVPFPDIPTESLQATTDSEEKPSIFCHGYPLLVYSERQYLRRYYANEWQFIAFMRRWFDLDVRSYLEFTQEKQHLARRYYHGIDYDNFPCGRDATHRLPEYLLINSCIVLFTILLFQNVRNGIEILSGTKETKRVPCQRSSEFYILYQYIMENPLKIKLQMLTMDYQIPWFVVESIYKNHSNLSKLVGTPIEKLALSCFDDLYPGVHKSKVYGGTVSLPPGGFKHLLHIFHWSRTPGAKFLVETRSLLQVTKNMSSFYIPSATDLQLSAIVFKKHASIDVSFCDRKLSGVMQIAPLHIFEYSFVIYENLLRFERGYMDCGFSITAYVGCIVKLLQAQEDVKLLRANGIIPGTGNDEMGVLSFVQRFKTILSDVYMPDDLYDLSRKVRAHHEKTSSRYYAEFKSRYCANPWIAISVVAGVCLFFLTFIQAVIQAVFGTLSYYKH